MNAQLWSEVIRSFNQVEWQLYPKIFGLAERAWNNDSQLSVSQYNTLVYETCLPRLAKDGHNFHIQQPGIHIKRMEESLQVEMNKVMLHGEIWYRLDDSEWQVYEHPFILPQGVKVIKSKILYLGKESNTTWSFL